MRQFSIIIFAKDFSASFIKLFAQNNPILTLETAAPIQTQILPCHLTRLVQPIPASQYSGSVAPIRWQKVQNISLSVSGSLSTISTRPVQYHQFLLHPTKGGTISRCPLQPHVSKVQ
jgi:hypothetical protein